MSDILDQPRRGRGRPATGQRDISVQVMLYPNERRRLDALLSQRTADGTRSRAALLRDLLMRELEAAGIVDPGAQPADEAEVTAA